MTEEAGFKHEPSVPVFGKAKQTTSRKVRAVQLTHHFSRVHSLPTPGTSLLLVCCSFLNTAMITGCALRKDVTATERRLYGADPGRTEKW